MTKVSQQSREIEKQIVHVLERIGFASARHLSRNYIDATPQRIGNIINHSDRIEMLDSGVTKKTWRLKG